MNFEVTKAKHVSDGTEMSFVENGVSLTMPKRTTTPHPDLINGLAMFDAHCAARCPYATREGDIKGKRMKWENPDTNKVETWTRPEFSDKQMADDFTCTSFHLTSNGAIGLHCNVKQEGKGSTGFNIKPINLVEGELFDTYIYLEDLRRVLKIVQKEFELYRNGKVDPRSQSTSTGEENVPSVGTEATSITGVGGKEDGIIDPAQRLKEVNETIEKGKEGETWEEIQARTAGTRGAAAKRPAKGKNAQTPDNPAGK